MLVSPDSWFLVEELKRRETLANGKYQCLADMCYDCGKVGHNEYFHQPNLDRLTPRFIPTALPNPPLNRTQTISNHLPYHPWNPSLHLLRWKPHPTPPSNPPNTHISTHAEPSPIIFPTTIVTHIPNPTTSEVSKSKPSNLCSILIPRTSDLEDHPTTLTPSHHTNQTTHTLRVKRRLSYLFIR